MALYNNSLYLPPILLPNIDSECPDNLSDDRVRIAEVEAAFEEFERDLVTQVQPLPASGTTLVRRRRVFRALGVIGALSGVGLLGYRIFVSTPQYDGPEVDLRGKTVLVTESTARSSRELLQGLARRGAQLILATENADDCVSTRDKLLRATSISASRVDCRRLQLDSTTSVRRFAANVLADYPRIDRAVIQSPSCVTSVVAGKWRPTSDGFEHQLGTNYFSTFLLTRLLWDRLSESEGLLILVADTDAAQEASAEALGGTPGNQRVSLPLNNLNFDGAKDYEPKKAYQRSQWFLTLFADELARRNAHSNGASVVLTNPRVSHATAPSTTPSTNPSLIMNSLHNVYSHLLDFTARLLKRRTATTALYCAIADSNQLELTGTIKEPSDAQLNKIACAPVYQDMRLVRSSTRTGEAETIKDSEEAARLLWAVSDKWTRMDTHPQPLPLPGRPTINVEDAATMMTVDPGSHLGDAPLHS